MDIQEFLWSLPGPNRFLVIMPFLLLILYFTYRNMRERAEGQEELKQKLESLRKTVERKNIRLNEIHHRIKNNLQVLSHMFREDRNRVEDVNWEQRLDTYHARVRGIGMIHDVLNESAEQEFLELKPYLERVVHKSSQLLSTHTSGVDVSTDIDRMTIDRRMATSCGLIANELMTNCYQHAFENDDDAWIRITLDRVNGHVEFTVSDNGSGSTEASFAEESNSMGSDIVSSLVKSDLQGDIDVHHSDRGTEVHITFPAVYGSTED